MKDEIEMIESALSNISFYKTHEYMKPFIGKNYQSPAHKKLLLIGESLYLPSGSIINQDIENWYMNPILSDDENDYCNTRNTRKWKSGRFSKTIDAEIKRIYPNSDCNAFEECAFYNYFLRPANEKKSFKEICLPIDHEYAIKNLKSILEILKPDLFVLLSRFVCASAEGAGFFNYFGENLWDYTKKARVKYIYTNHPSRACWNNATNPAYFHEKTSSQFFCDFLKDNF